MSESSRIEGDAPHQATEDGWCLEKNSWAFHRSAFRILGHPLAFGEYGHLRRQISSGEAELLRFGDEGGLYRARLRDGTELDVLARKVKGKKLWYTLTKAMRPQSKPRAVAPPASAPAVQAPQAPSPAPPAAAPLPPEPIRRASTLTLGTSARTAAEVLAARLQPKPPPPRMASVSAQKSQAQAGRHTAAPTMPTTH